MSAPQSPEPVDPHQDPHAVPHDAEHFHDHSRLYLGIGAILMVCTALTVGISYIHFGSHSNNILVGMALAAFKATLVALIFMHLKNEKGTIYQFMFFTLIFVIGLFGLSVLALLDPIRF